MRKTRDLVIFDCGFLPRRGDTYLIVAAPTRNLTQIIETKAWAEW